MMALCGAGFILGASGGAIYYFAEQLHRGLVYALLGGGIGCALGFASPMLRKIYLQLKSSSLRPSEVTVGPSGATLKLVVDNAQRRAAMKIFIQISSRITLRPMNDNVGDDGEAIESLYEFVKFARQTVTDIDADLPDLGDTLEIYVLGMVNDVLAKFLEKWHVEWDTWVASRASDNKSAETKEWPMHDEFRVSLRRLQADLRPFALDIAKAAGVPDPESRFPILRSRAIRPEAQR